MKLVDLRPLRLCNEAVIVSESYKLCKRICHPASYATLIKFGLGLHEAVSLARGGSEWVEIDSDYEYPCYRLGTVFGIRIYLCRNGLFAEIDGELRRLPVMDSCIEEARARIGSVAKWLRVAPPKIRNLITSRIIPRPRSADEAIRSLQALCNTS